MFVAFIVYDFVTHAMIVCVCRLPHVAVYHFAFTFTHFTLYRRLRLRFRLPGCAYRVYVCDRFARLLRC